MSLRRAARVFACFAIASFTFSSTASADEAAAAADHASELITKVYQVSDLVIPLASTDVTKPTPDFDWLMDLIELRTGADCWAHSGGHGAISAHESTLSLVIRQTRATHERISDLLNEVRGTGDLALCVEIQLIHGNLEACGDAKPHRTAQGLVDASGKDRLLQTLKAQEGSEILAAPKITFFNGTTASIETAENGCSKVFNIRGVISKDNRYARLWLDSKVDGQTTKAELLVPEGHTAVRKLPGESSWLLVTSHVINAEEPQVVAPAKAPPAPAAEQKRYLVPVDDTPEPTELTGIPEFKAQAEDFGLAIQRAKAELEKTAGITEAQPKLASNVEHVEYQVAQAEPRYLTGFPIPTPQPVIGFVDELLFTPGAGPLLNASGFENRLTLNEEKPGKAVVHCFEVNPQPEEPPARLNVCLDDSECQSASKSRPQSGQLFNQIFVTPVPTFPGLDWKFQSVPGPVSGGSITIDHWKSPPPATVTNVEFGRRAILTKQKPKPFPEASNGVAFVAEPSFRKVEPASGIHSPVTSIETHLTTAAAGLEELGLPSEAKVLRALLHSIHIRAEERCQQIDQEIAKLKAARKKLEDLANHPAASATENAVEVR